MTQSSYAGASSQGGADQDAGQSGSRTYLGAGFRGKRGPT